MKLVTKKILRVNGHKNVRLRSAAGLACQTAAVGVNDFAFRLTALRRSLLSAQQISMSASKEQRQAMASRTPRLHG